MSDVAGGKGYPAVHTAPDLSTPATPAAAHAAAAGLRPSIGWGGLLVVGIANVLGAGVYVMTGTAAAQFSGPAVTLSFVTAGVACLLVALCYAELASCVPESGSAYSYCRRALGGGPAWALGWLLFLEYSIAASLLAVGFAGYLGSLLNPDLVRKFRVPLGGFQFRGMWIGYVPVAAIVTSFVMTLPVALDILNQARRGDWMSVTLLTVYALAGWSIYRFYGRARAAGRPSLPPQSNLLDR